MIPWSTYLTYDPETGIFRWKERGDEISTTGRSGNWTQQYAGKVAGHKSRDGYLMIGVRGGLYGAHRIAWQMTEGPIPRGMKVDHINGNGLDNRRCNLRLSTHGQNRSNSKASSSTGLKGVYRENSKFRAQIRVNRRCINIGTFPLKCLAAIAYAKASLRYQGKFSVFMRKAA